MDKCKILKSTKNIAIVGLSSNRNRISRNIASYLVNAGYNVVGVNPNQSFTDAEGIVVYNSLIDIPFEIDIVNVFRKSEDIPYLVDEILKVKPFCLWLQQGIRNDLAVKPIVDNNILVIQDSCIMVEHSYC
ncbi:MAG: CoA-binding protein [Melioribacteraceae bacterium]|nr:CoA-binding protein [Melioribacteraceae bacterium]